jgi:Tfp pilus assembly protein PilV
MREAVLRLPALPLAHARSQGGFGMVELLASMTVMLIGLLAVFGLFQAGIVQIRRASTATTAAALADAEMERYRARLYETIGLDNTDVAAVVADSALGPAYTADQAYKAETSPTTTLAGSGITTTGQTQFSVTSASGFPATNPYIVKIGSEFILVGQGGGTTTWTASEVGGRGYLGTAAAAHASGSTVTQVKRVHVVKCGSAPCTTSVPSKTVTGADGRPYRVDTFITWETITNVADGSTCTPPACSTGRPAKLVTIVVRENAAPYRTLARLSSSFDESTGL